MSAHHTDYAAMGLPTGLGENAFTDTRISSVFAIPAALKAAKRAADTAAMDSKNKGATSIYGLSRKGDEAMRKYKLATALKPINGFNVPIATPEQGVRTRWIAGKP